MEFFFIFFSWNYQKFEIGLFSRSEWFRSQTTTTTTTMLQELFKNRTGTKVAHGSPGYENVEVIESITTREGQEYATIQFESGCFTHIPKDALAQFFVDGEIQYDRASGFTAIESIIDLQVGDDDSDDFDDDSDEPREDNFRDDVDADANTLASAGYGTDEDYGYYGEDNGWD